MKLCKRKGFAEGVLAFALLAASASVWGMGQPRELFNGKDLTGWYTYLRGYGRNNDPKGVVSVKDGVLHISGEVWGAVVTEEEFSDYRLDVAYRFTGTRFGDKAKKALDSGILFHSTGPDGAFQGTWLYSHEYNLITGASGDIWTVGDAKARPDMVVEGETGGTFTEASMPEGPYRNHAVWKEGGKKIELRGNRRLCRCDIAPDWTDTPAARPAANERPTGEWNTATLVCRGESVECWFNGKLVNKATRVVPSRGKIQLQSEGCGVEFRRVTLRRLEPLPVPGFSFSYDGVVKNSNSLTVDERLKVTVEKTAFPEADAVEWKLWFENPSAERSGVISDICDGDFLVAMEPDAVRHPCEASKPGDRAVIAMRGCVGEGTWDYTFDDESSATEFAPKPYYLREQTWTSHVTISNRNARSSNGMAPFFNVTYRDAGTLVAIGWTGDWKAEFANVPEGVRVKTGLKRTRFRLEPGEKVRTSSVLVMNYVKGEDASNKFRNLIRTHFSHVATSGGRESEGIFATELWGASTTETMIGKLRMFEREKVLTDFLWVDAGWYGKGEAGGDTMTSDWPSYCGDWQINPAIHPDGFRDVAAEVRRLGMRFLLWFTPENIGAKSEAKKRHPDWVLDPHDGYALLNLGNPDARADTFRMIDGFVRDLGLGCYRQDSNQGLTKHFALGDAPDRVGITEIRHITGMYGLWDDLRAAHPGLLIDNCASGGRRIDIETLRRSHPFFRSDYQCNRNYAPEVVQAHNANLAWWLPYQGCTTKRTDLYALRSAYSSSYGVAACEADDRVLTADDFVTLRKAFADYRRIRRFFSRNFYNHGSRTADLSAWAVWQYLDPATSEGCVLAFRRPESPNDRMSIDLKGVSGALDFTDLDTGKTVRGTAKLEITLPERRSSAIILFSNSLNSQP